MEKRFDKAVCQRRLRPIVKVWFAPLTKAEMEAMAGLSVPASAAVTLAVTLAATLAIGALCGATNGVLTGDLRIRSFLATLVTPIIIRSIADIILLQYAVTIWAAVPESELWYFIGEGAS